MKKFYEETMFGWKKKKKKEIISEVPSNSNQSLEILDKNIDLKKLTAEIENFLKKSDDPFDYAEYTIHDLPEKKGKYFKIEHGMKSPTAKFVIVMEGNENNLKIYDHIPKNYPLFADFVISDLGAVYKYVNAKAFKVKLWDFIVKTTKSLEH